MWYIDMQHSVHRFYRNFGGVRELVRRVQQNHRCPQPRTVVLRVAPQPPRRLPSAPAVAVAAAAAVAAAVAGAAVAVAVAVAAVAGASAARRRPTHPGEHATAARRHTNSAFDSVLCQLSARAFDRTARRAAAAAL